MITTKTTYEYGVLAEKLFLLCETSYDHGSPWSVQQFLADLENANSHYLLFEKADEIIGFISFHQVLDEIEILHVVVSSAKKGQGIGRQLLQALFHYGEAEQGKIFLEVRESNEQAQNLYQKNGFKQMAKRKNYYRGPVEDAWVMVKEVRSTKEE